MRYKVLVSYDGSNYIGFQKQEHGLSIQREIEKAFKNMTQIMTPIYASGRTDKHVHAKAQVFHFDSDLPIEENIWVEGLNRRLPLDIRILKVSKVKGDFHARLSAKKKTYMYKIAKNESSAFNSKYEVYVKDFDVSKIMDAPKYLEGTHDFKGFCKNVLNKATIKTILNVSIVETKKYVYIYYTANGFLRYMARSITGLLIEIALNKKTLADIERVLKTGDRVLAGKKAPAQGLYLMKVYY